MLKGARAALVPRTHPARALLALERRQLSDVAADLGYCPAYVGRVLNKRMPATAEFRRRLARYLGRPEEELFDEALAS